MKKEIEKIVTTSDSLLFDCITDIKDDINDIRQTLSLLCIYLANQIDSSDKDGKLKQ